MSHPVVPEEPGIGPTSGRMPGFLVSLIVATGLGLIGASELWAVLAVHTGRRVAPSARFRLVGDGPTWGSPSEQFSVWSAFGMEYVVLENARLVHQGALDDLDARCPGMVQLQASWAAGMLVRLGWDDACRALVVP